MSSSLYPISGFHPTGTFSGYAALRTYQPQFGAIPPRLFTTLNDEEKEKYKPGDRWVNPDGTLTEKDIEEMLEMPEGALRLFQILGPRELVGRLGWRGLLEKMNPLRLLKETVKYLIGDNVNQDYTPLALNGTWAHNHDRDHLFVSTLPRIKMGKYEGVNGVDGIGAQTAPHFHPEDPRYKGNEKYPGMLDEYRVAIHQYLRDKTPISKVRLAYYIMRHIDLVPNPRKAIEAHRKAMEDGPQSTDRSSVPISDPSIISKAVGPDIKPANEKPDESPLDLSA